MKKAMSMIEIIFVIVIIGILAGVAVPKIFTGRNDAYALKLKETVSLIRSGIARYKQESLYSTGASKYPDGLCMNITKDSATSCMNNMTKDRFFAAVLKKTVNYGSKQGDWNGWTNGVTHETFIYYIDDSKNGYVFQYNKDRGSFRCLNAYKTAKVLPCKNIGEIGYDSEE